MKKRLLILGAFALMSAGMFAQSSLTGNQAKVWLKPSSNNTSQGLNQYAPIEVNSNQWHNFTNEKANFYVVFRSFAAEKTNLVDYHFACYDASLHTGITDARIPSKELMQRKMQTGAIFKHSLDLPSAYINPSENKSYFVVQEMPENQVYEVMYFDQSFDHADHQRVQTYLSLKYGVSLLEKNNYVNQNGQSVWNVALDARFNEHIFGLARIDQFDLMQKQSVNSLQPVLTLSSADNFANEEYLMLGDNAGQLTFIDQDGEKVLDRKYLYQNRGGDKQVSLAFDYTAIDNFDKDKIYALRINHESTQMNVEQADVYLGRTIDNQLVFDNVSLHNHGLITLTNMANAASTEHPEWATVKNMQLYPNPVKAGEKFHIDLQFNQATNVEVYVYQVNGKLVSHKSLTSITAQTFEDSLTAAGNYIVMVQAAGKLNTFKLLVQ